MGHACDEGSNPSLSVSGVRNSVRKRAYEPARRLTRGRASEEALGCLYGVWIRRDAADWMAVKSSSRWSKATSLRIATAAMRQSMSLRTVCP